LKSEEVVLLKKLVGQQAQPLIVGQIVEILEGEDT
jgi:hypothetical protein